MCHGPEFIIPPLIDPSVIDTTQKAITVVTKGGTPEWVTWIIQGASILLSSYFTYVLTRKHQKTVYRETLRIESYKQIKTVFAKYRNLLGKILRRNLDADIDSNWILTKVEKSYKEIIDEIEELETESNLVQDAITNSHFDMNEQNSLLYAIEEPTSWARYLREQYDSVYSQKLIGKGTLIPEKEIIKSYEMIEQGILIARQEFEKLSNSF